MADWGQRLEAKGRRRAAGILRGVLNRAADIVLQVPLLHRRQVGHSGKVQVISIYKNAQLRWGSPICVSDNADGLHREACSNGINGKQSSEVPCLALVSLRC